MSEDKKFRYIGGQAWVEWTEPQIENSEYAKNRYPNRPHYDVQPKPKEWEEGRLIIEGVDFEFTEFYGDIILGGQPILYKRAIPLIQPTMKEERKFTLDEMLEYGEAAKLFTNSGNKYGQPFSNAKQYFKEEIQHKIMTDSKDNTPIDGDDDEKVVRDWIKSKSPQADRGSDAEAAAEEYSKKIEANDWRDNFNRFECITDFIAGAKWAKGSDGLR